MKSTGRLCSIRDDLDHLAGTWSAEDADDFLRATAVFEKVDERYVEIGEAVY